MVSPELICKQSALQTTDGAFSKRWCILDLLDKKNKMKKASFLKECLATHPVLLMIHSTSCLMLLSKGNESPLPKKGLCLFFIAAASELISIGKTGLPVDVKQLSTEQLPRQTITLEASLFSRVAASSDNEGIFAE